MANILALPLLLAALASPGLENATYTLNARPPAASAPSEATTPFHGLRELTVLSYNVRGLPWPIAKGRRKALQEIGRELAELRRQGKAPDIVLIQENFDRPDALVRLSGYRYSAQGPTRRDRPSERLPSDGFALARYLISGEGWGKLTGSGLYVLSNFPIMEVATDVFGYCAGFDCIANKGVMMVHLDIPGLPGGLDVVNTHMNSLGAAKVPARRSLKAHNLQTEALNRFIARVRTPGAGLLVGGDFNVKDAPERYDYKAEVRPFKVVSEFCKVSTNGCASGPAIETPKPWLASEDLQAFSDQGGVTIRPLSAGTLFDGAAFGERLSDHDGYQVRYRLAWR